MDLSPSPLDDKDEFELDDRDEFFSEVVQLQFRSREEARGYAQELKAAGWQDVTISKGDFCTYYGTLVGYWVLEAAR